MSVASVWSGRDLLEAFSLAALLLATNRATIDALNVYPVPDGDTGTNMSLTMDAALAEVRSAGGTDPAINVVAQQIARGSLLGARGNSGVILSQIWRGFANELAEAERIDGRDLARALGGASEVAYKAVTNPVEGTMLTVIRVASEEALAVARKDPSLDLVLEAASRGATRALADTPNMLSQLRDAGVVDSGGQGVVVILESFLAAARGTSPDLSALSMTGPAEVSIQSGDHDSFGYCTNFMISGTNIDFVQVRSTLAQMGQSTVIVGDDRQVKVHIHTEDPGETLSFAVRWGALSQIKIDNMNAQVERFTSVTDQTPPTGRAIVAVASGLGLQKTFTSLGVRVVVDGGSTMNPSIQQLTRAIQETGAAEVVLLPNNGNVLMAASQAAELSDRAVIVIPTRSVVQGMSAANTFNEDQSLEQVIARMTRASSRAATIEIAKADKNALIDGIEVRQGQIIGILNDRLVAADDELIEVVRTVFNVPDLDAPELITLFSGKDLRAEDSYRVIQSLQDLCGDADIEHIEGGQPHYLLIIAVE